MLIKHLYPLLFLIVFAKTQSQNVVFEEFDIKNTSIRAIQVINDSVMYFAGSKGKFGSIVGNKINLDSINFDGKNLNFRSIAFNSNHLFILSIENPAVLYKIKPLGNKFDKPKIVYQEKHSNVFYDAIKFYDTKTGIAMGDPTDACLSVILTKDGGNTWLKISCDKLPKTFEGEAAFAASNTNIATYGKKTWLVTGGKKARVFISNKFGEDWEAVDTPIVQGKKMTGIFTVDFYDKNNGIIMGGNWENKGRGKGTKAITKNGGKSWQLVADGELPGHISCVQYVPDTKGKKIVAVSTEGIFFSKNKGKHWKKISDKGYYSIQFINKNKAWLSSDNKISKMSIHY
ncbi:MAG: oxidoreductase [Flavobacteriaceae bacterium]|nr:oxidoreductase [Flavobacteriaceae bacterium]